MKPLHIQFQPFPELHTPNLILRRLVQADAPDVFLLRSNKDLMKYIPKPLAQTVADAEALLALIEQKIQDHVGINWGITRKGNSEVLGVIGYVQFAKEHYRAEVGYILKASCQGQGLMAEALRAVLDYGFDVMNLNSIEAFVHPDNTASQKLLEKMKFVREAYLKEYLFHNGAFVDKALYSLLKANR